MASLAAGFPHKETLNVEVAAIDAALRALGPVSYMVARYDVGHGQLVIWLMRDGRFRPKVGKLALHDSLTMHGDFNSTAEHVASLALDGDSLRLKIGTFEATALKAWFGDADEVAGE